jgi:hypothetical protein
MRKSILAVGLVVATLAAAGLAPAQESKPAETAPVPPTSPVAASPCAKLPETECGSTTGCVWLPGYKVAGGAEVAGYCRPAPKPLTARRPPSGSQ